MKKGCLKSFFVLTLAIIMACVVVYSFQLTSSYIWLLLTKSYEKSTLFYYYVFGGIFILGIIEFLILYLTRINQLSLKSMMFLVRTGKRPRFILAISTIFITSCLSMLMGLALGSEAPSMYLGGSIFCLVFYLFYNKKKDDRYVIVDVMSIGSGTGFGIAFENPLAGLLMSFVGRDIKKITWKKCLESLYSNLLGWVLFSLFRMAYYPNNNATTWFDNFKYMGYSNKEWLQLSSDGYIVLLLVPSICFICAFIYVVLIGTYRKLATRDYLWSYMISLILVTLVSGLLFIFYDGSISGSGMSLIMNRSTTETLSYIFTLLGLRMILTILSFDGHFFGGMVIPTISIGALLGEAFVSIMIWSNSSYSKYSDYEIILVAFMIGFYACVSAKPFVAFALSFSFIPMHIAIGPMLVCLVPIAIVIYTSNYHGLSNLMLKIDEEDGVSYYHRRLHIRNFIRM